MAEPPPQRHPTDPAPEGPEHDAPQLLVMPPTAAVPSIVWPGAEGEPAWAIPIRIPSGTRGYAVFLPMVPVGPTTEQAAPAAVAAPVAETAAVAAPIAVEEPAAEALVAEDPAAETPAVEQPETEPPMAEEPVVATPAVVEPAEVVPEKVEEEAKPTARRTTAPPPPGWVYGAGGARYQPPPTAWERFRDRHWPGPARVKGRAVPAAVLVSAIGIATLLPLDRVGIGWFLAWLVLTLSVGFVVRRGTATLPRTERWIRAAWALAALALLAVPAVRNAWWLATFSVLGALCCTALAIAGGRQIRSILFSLIAVPYAALKGIPWVRGHIEASRNAGMVRRVVFSIGITLVVLLVFGGLLSSADVAFSTLLNDAVPDVDIGSIFRWIFLAVLGALVAVAGTYTLSAPPTTTSMDTDGDRRLGLVEWAPAGFGLVLLFAGFVAVQFTVLFGGDQHVLKTSGLSYAEYARSGFWQLVLVTLLTLAVLGAVARWARRDTAAERVLLRTVLGLLCALSIVIVASALSRMWTYQKVYSFTGERIFVMSFEILLGTVFVMIAAAGVRWRGRWIPRATVGLAVLMLLGLAVLDPEDYAASRNIVRYEKTGKIDAWYLRALSADATPALTGLPDPLRRCTLSWIADDLSEPDPWYAWNLGREQAREALKKAGPAAVGNHRDCKAADEYDLPKTRR
ncbi:DUF4153 domain-containing protein [Actinoplanes sp. NPDC051851]|uniref:DUF4153 domain-containing protein n=1 Tax=Actinoplanes sp. NPDC051851 TaxID=3154753 RepID=UPI00343B7CA4